MTSQSPPPDPVTAQAAPPDLPIERTPVRKVLDRLAWEIELAAVRCTLIDSVIGQVIDRLDPAECYELIETLHGVDLLNQHLQGLASFSRNLSQRVSARSKVSVAEALGDVSLGSLAERLGVSMGAAQAAEHETESGQVDLF